MPAGFRWSAPYVNYDQRRLFRPADNIPVLLQPGLAVKELRRSRVGFIAMRLASPRFVWEKINAVIRGAAAAKYIDIIRKGLIPRWY